MIEAGSKAPPRSGPSGRGVAKLLVIAVVTGAIGLGIGLGLHFALTSSSAPATIVSSRHGLDGQATWAAGAHPAPAITTLKDQNGRLFSLASLHGRTVAIVFFDSHCQQECPLEGHALAAAERTLPAAQRPVLVAVSVNPLDTEASVRKAIRSWGLAGVAPWYWLMGKQAQLSPVWNAYRIYVGKAVHGDIPHTEAVYLVDRHGFERSAYLYPFAQRFVVHDMRALDRVHG